MIEIEINAYREFWLKTENKYFWTDFNVNAWLINVTQICPRMLKNTSQSVWNFNFFCRSMPPEPPRGACCYASTIHFSRLLSSDQTPIIFSNHNHGREPCKEYWYSLKRLKSKSRWGNEKIIPSKEKRREEAFESLSTKKTKRNFYKGVNKPTGLGQLLWGSLQRVSKLQRTAGRIILDAARKTSITLFNNFNSLHFTKQS